MDRVQNDTAYITKIETPRLVLRPINEQDAARIHSISQQTSGKRYMVFDDEREVIEWIRWVETNREKPSKAFAVENKIDATVIGIIGVGPKNELDGEIELVYLIAEEHQNYGYATEAGKAMIWWIFEQAGQSMISTTINPENNASRRVLHKLGFIYGGKRELLRKDGIKTYDYFRLYHTDTLPGPEWDILTLCKAEPMDDFFDVRAYIYNDKMLSNNGIEDYIKLGACFPKTGEPIKILDIGCGTGIELKYIWEQAPNAHITCVDVSCGMLDLLMSAYPDNHDRITIVEASYLDWAYPESCYDIVVSNMTMHHLFPDEKTSVYRKILSTLITGGCYIEGDFTMDAIAVEQYRRRYEIITANLPEKAKPGEYHIDIPCTVETQVKLLQDAGFCSVEVVDISINHSKGAIIIARRG